MIKDFVSAELYPIFHTYWLPILSVFVGAAIPILIALLGYKENGYRSRNISEANTPFKTPKMKSPFVNYRSPKIASPANDMESDIMHELNEYHATKGS